MNSPVLSVRQFGVDFGDKTVLEEVNLEVYPGEILVMLGPGGAGKSTLVRTICGDNENNASMQVRGRVVYRDREVGAGHRPPLVEQTPGEMMTTVFEYLASRTPGRSEFTRRELRERLDRRLDQLQLSRLRGRWDEVLLDLSALDRRLTMLVGASLGDPGLLCIDEPMAGLEEEAGRMISLLQDHRDRWGVLLVTHNQQRARRVGDRVALLAGGRIREVAGVSRFFEDPETPEARSFVGTGSCTVASPDAEPEQLAPEYRRRRGDDGSERRREVVLLSSDSEDSQRQPSAPSARRGPVGFEWLRPGRLAGTPLPGGMRELETDLEALRRVGVTTLVTLTRTPLPAETLGAFDIADYHLPITDMKAPEFEEALECLKFVQRELGDGRVVAFHCRAGIGRTGTMLAAYEIFEGMSAREALEAVRQVHRRWVQSTRQEQFLEEFESWLS